MTTTVCGPKLSLCCLILSVWGVIQLSLMGLFFHVHAVALAEDIVVDANVTDVEKFYEEVDEGYTRGAQNCWLAAAMYAITLLVSAQQFWANQRLETAL
ncbi:hypothetical protein BDFB_011545 [Asbolus verrucosus]|uniref:Uncharacterized protein n=1 Tax=Asbolus verrucosus TaxID=1661398 RepID=A0A482VXP1_ASBVE|nr:hypothetical protein BDFB_011545 [Asbolus verrucosus]